MNASIDYTSQKIQACDVATDERMKKLPWHFGRDMLTVEAAVYAFMRKLAKDYDGGYWTLFEFPNGRFYIALESGTELHVPSREA